MMNCIENPQTETRSSHCMHNKKPCHAIEPITGLATVAVGVVATFLTSFTAITCQFKECCTKKWIKLNVTGISSHIYMDNFACDLFCFIVNVYSVKSSLELMLYCFIMCGIKIKFSYSYDHLPILNT
jgi:hypothetical protein